MTTADLRDFLFALHDLNPMPQLWRTSTEKMSATANKGTPRQSIGFSSAPSFLPDVPTQDAGPAAAVDRMRVCTSESFKNALHFEGGLDPWLERLPILVPCHPPGPAIAGLAYVAARKPRYPVCSV